MNLKNPIPWGLPAAGRQPTPIKGEGDRVSVNGCLRLGQSD
jgi:hypothetical protein